MDALGDGGGGGSCRWLAAGWEKLELLTAVSMANALWGGLI